MTRDSEQPSPEAWIGQEVMIISGVASVYRCAERLGLDFVGKEADREEIVGQVRNLQEAGYAKIAAGVQEVNTERLALGGISLTEDG
ncbi:MAG: hypothetical protein M3R38_15830 [Actinomycetota bacterium]|nr:hypothetical protein [Actinomycetota bacterium]